MYEGLVSHSATIRLNPQCYRLSQFNNAAFRQLIQCRCVKEGSGAIKFQCVRISHPHSSCHRLFFVRVFSSFCFGRVCGNLWCVSESRLKNSCEAGASRCADCIDSFVSEGFGGRERRAIFTLWYHTIVACSIRYRTMPYQCNGALHSHHKHHQHVKGNKPEHNRQ